MIVPWITQNETKLKFNIIMENAETSVPDGEGPVRFSKRYSRRQWLSDTRSIQVVLFQLRVTI